MAGKFKSFVAGLLISAFFSPIVAIIVGLVWKEKSTRAYWIGAFFGIFMLLLLLIVIAGINLLTAFGFTGFTVYLY